MSDKLTRLACWTPIVQAFLTLVIAVSSGWWSVTAHMSEQARLEQQQKRDRDDVQKEAISQMTVQLVLMRAQCPKAKLRSLLESENPTDLQRRCYEAYIGARSLLVQLRWRIVRDPQVNDNDWNESWDYLDQTLRDASYSIFDSKEVFRAWRDILEKSSRP